MIVSEGYPGTFTPEQWAYGQQELERWTTGASAYRTKRRNDIIPTYTPPPVSTPPYTPPTPTTYSGYPTTSYPTYSPTYPTGTLGPWSERNAPPTPHWLPQVSPGQVSGQPMQKLPVKTPSGQLWSQFMPSWRGGLESYINYAAGTAGVIASYQDLLAQILMMQPRRSPYRAGQWNTGGVW